MIVMFFAFMCVLYQSFGECQGEKAFSDTTLFRVRQRLCSPRLVRLLYHNLSQCQASGLCFFEFFCDVSPCQ